MLVADEVVGTWGLLPPFWYKDCDGLVASGFEPIHADLDATAGEDFFVSMTEIELRIHFSFRAAPRRSRFL